MSLENVIYRAQAHVTGGRTGHATASTPALDLTLSTPRELGGGGGEGTNPEQLFAAGYSACFIGALKLVASRAKVALPEDLAVDGIVGIGPVGKGFGIEAELRVSMPGVPREQAESLVAKAHEVCPYSNATRNNIDVTLTVVE
ncbi:organic hydroperoxide resistance protein [Haliangium ochraceum]|uniref:Peroxiredoxin, Ohr subfamily n=1 Tax=Haliangium ochraceum (strain DSM 14365 / JCM 11303 / SMP-2) TaxID=502025 RepID=D0LWU5_HALO1|nr:organic hydroperoxide resistance protein [Haliangium ochraceum]ACY14192.1 peroxiredoxin, Ohr subfamily [Haliangium ochraceum DSM 14365]